MANTKQRSGVIASLSDQPDGTLRLTFDDVRAKSPDSGEWQRVTLYTYGQLDAAKLNDMSFSEKELADIAASLLARLAAIRETDA
jgi:hypothetical protein